jgi:uncharacterized protein (DUF1697 family)
MSAARTASPTVRDCLRLNEDMAASTHRIIILLRGINVGGHHKLPMAQLRDLCESVGCTDVATYVQSGNVVATSKPPAKKLSADLEAALQEAVGFTPCVVIRKRSDLLRVIENNPYPHTEEQFLHVGFLSATPSKSALAELGEVDCSPESYTIAGAEIYLNYINGAGRSLKLGKVPFERKLGLGMTARNMRTVKKLADLSA